MSARAGFLTMRIAGLPMYDLAEATAATDAWWAGLARAFRREGVRDVPDRLCRDGSPDEHWLAPDLLFSQTCGYPLVNALAGRVKPIATPCYGAPECAGADYCSLVIVRADSLVAGIADLAGAACAVNEAESHSGYNTLRALAAPFSRGGRFFGRVVVSGAHVASLALVASGGADVAAIDCVTHALLARHRPAALAGTRVLCRSGSAPGLPYVTAAGTDDETLRRLRAGLSRALADPDLAAARADLLIAGAVELPATAYGRILEVESEAAALGYARLA
ncbi:MAG: PhnD/SsuA/transferrin family substrate-binding protein [Dongiaceae bacterium]